MKTRPAPRDFPGSAGRLLVSGYYLEKNDKLNLSGVAQTISIACR